METMLVLNPSDIIVMSDHAKREFPDECCGVILGSPSDPSRNEVRPCANIQRELKERYPHLYSRDADTGYYMDPKDLKSAFDDASRRGLEVVGFYHSHPNHDAYWSDEDHRASLWAGTDEPSFPDTSHVVISVYDGEVKDIAIFTWRPEIKEFVRGNHT